MIHRKSECMPEVAPDPLASVVALLKPRPDISKMVVAGGRWQVERTDLASPFYAAIVDGCAHLVVERQKPILLRAGDFVIVPELNSFTMTSELSPPPGVVKRPLETGPGIFRLGPVDSPVEMRALVGHCRFDAPDRALLLSVLPQMIHVRGQDRLTALVTMIYDETSAERPARAMILDRLLEVLMIEALRSGSSPDLPPGLVRGLSDPRLGVALHRINNAGDSSITVKGLAQQAGMSRSAFFERFKATLGCAPMEYAIRWRMAVARDLLMRGQLTNAEIAHQVGYGSASAFGMAFVRHWGMSPRAFIEGRAKD
jgi:AraC-like DNA-binding protein